MSFTCDVNATYGFALIRATGDEWTGTDLLYSAEAVVSDDRFVPDHDWVYDLRFVRRTVIGPEDMDALVDRFQTYREDGRVDPDARSVIVANEDILRTTGVLYKYRAGRPDDLFTIVNTMEEARKWLGIEESASESGLES